MYRYIPILRWKKGERLALGCTPAAAAHEVVPLIVLTGELKGKKETKKAAAVSGPDFFAREIHKVWGARPFFVDASSAPPAPRGQHILDEIARNCRAVGAHLIPATILDAPPPYQAAVSAVVSVDRRGVALRVKLQELTLAAQWFPTWQFPAKDTDLIVDFADNVGVVARLGNSLDHVFEHLHSAGQWRTVTVSGSSMPENFGGYNRGLHIIPRAELRVWQQLVNLNLPYRIDYSDYATVPLVPPPEGIAWGFPINVRYTLPADFLVCRGVVTTGSNAVDLSSQLIGHAKSIVGYANRNPIQCWGDKTIDNIAVGKASSGHLWSWVVIGVNRHIELVRKNLP